MDTVYQVVLLAIIVALLGVTLFMARIYREVRQLREQQCHPATSEAQPEQTNRPLSATEGIDKR